MTLAHHVALVFLWVIAVLTFATLGTGIIVVCHRWRARRRKRELATRLRNLRDFLYQEVWAESADGARPSIPPFSPSDAVARDFLVQAARPIRGEMKDPLVRLYEASGFLQADLTALRAFSIRRRLASLDRLSVMANESCIPALVTVIQLDKSPIARVESARVLIQLRYMGYDVFLRLLEVPHRVMALVLADELVRIGRPILAPMASFVEQHPNSPNVGLAIRIMGEIKSSDAIAYFLAWTRSDQPEIRINAVRALGKLATPDSVGVLLERLSDPHPVVRTMAVRYLAELTEGTYQDKIAESLRDRYPQVAMEAASALLKIGWTKRDVPAEWQKWFDMATQTNALGTEVLI